MYEDYLSSGLPPYLNPAMQAYLDPAMQPYLDPAIGYISQYPMYGPTYGQFSPDYWSLMPTPYGGGMLPIQANPYYYTILRNPVKGFFTFSIPLFQAPKGLNPALFSNYVTETQFESIGMLGSGIASAGLSSLGYLIGGPFGSIVGGLIGYAMSGMIGKATARVMQIHEAANLLNLRSGANEYGVGISMSQATQLYNMFTREGSQNASFTAEEYQLLFSELARNSMIEDTGDFEQVKENLKRMKNVVLKLQDLFQNGDIKAIVDALRQLRMAGVNVTDLADISISSSVAATIMGQKAKDYITNTIANATQISAVTGISQQSLIELKNAIALGMPDESYKIKDLFLKGASNKELIEKLYNLITGASQETSNIITSNFLRARGVFSIQDYMITALEAGILEYNKEHKTSYNLLSVASNTQLAHEISTEYAPKAMQKLMDRFNGDALSIYTYLANKDTTYLTGINDPQYRLYVLKHLKNLMDFMPSFWNYLAINSEKYKDVIKLRPGLFPQFEKMVELAKRDPLLFEEFKKSAKEKTRFAKEDTEYYELKRHYSLTGQFHEFLQSIQHRYAEIVNAVTPASISVAILKPDRQLSEVNTMTKLVKEAGFDESVNVLPKGLISMPESTLLSGAKLFLLGETKAQRLQSLLSWTLGISSVNIDGEFIERAFAYKRSSLAALSRYLKDLDEFIKNPEAFKGFQLEYGEYFNTLSKEDVEKPYTYDGKDYTFKDDEAKNIFKDLTNEIINLTRAIQELSRKPNLTDKDREKIKEYQEKIQTAKRSLVALYSADNLGPVELLKLMGKRIDYDNLKELTRDIISLKVNNPELFKEAVKGLAKLEGISEKTAEHILNQYAKAYDKSDVLRAWALKSGKTDFFIKEPLPLTGALGNFIASGGGKLISEVYKKVGNLNELIKGLQEVKKIQEELRIGKLYTGDSGGELLELLITAKESKLSPEKLKAIQKFKAQLESQWDTLTGGKTFKINGVEIKSAEDLFKASADVQREFFREVGSGYLQVVALKRLGSRVDYLYNDLGQLTKEGAKDLQTIFAEMVEYKDGKFVLKKSIQEELQNENVRQVLRDLGFKPSALGLQRFLDELNGNASSKLDRTNELLQKILNVLTQHKRPVLQV